MHDRLRARVDIVVLQHHDLAAAVVLDRLYDRLGVVVRDLDRRHAPLHLRLLLFAEPEKKVRWRGVQRGERRGLRTGLGSSCVNALAPQPPSAAGAMLPPKASSSSFGCCIAACIEPLDAPQSLEPEGSDAPSSSPQPPLSVVCESRYGVSGFQTCGPHARAQRRQVKWVE